jgi:DNA-binding response OmpR family regulator
MAAADPGPLRFDGLTLDPTGRTLVDARGEFISLRRSEFELLLAFVNNPGRALGRDYLLEGSPAATRKRSIAASTFWSAGCGAR